jgi:hypothetical protein
MKTRSWFVMAGLIVVVVALFALVPATFAQGPVDGTDRGTFGPGAGMMQQERGNGYGLGIRLGGPEESLVAVAAGQLDLTRAEVIAELQGGQTLAEVITAHNGDPAQVVETFLAGRGEQLAELVANGQISQEQADTWLATMQENATARLSQAWSPRGNGQGFVDEDGDGVCDNCGLGRGNGAGFVDEDGDGVCDNCGAGPRGGRMGQRWQ